MRTRFPRCPSLTASLLLLLASTLAAQSAPTDVRDEFLRHFEQSSMKIVRLAEAMPESLYTWSPGPGVMEVGQVYMHIARYNYLYPSTSLGVPVPEGITMDTMEEIRDKAVVLAALRRSVEHVRRLAGAMSDADLRKMTRLYGRDVAAWAVLMQLVAHMNEHVGQSVAYARMNGVVPPWSR